MFDAVNPSEKPPRWSVRNVLVALVFACLIPAVVGAGALFIYMVKDGRAQLEKDTILTARALIQTFDAELSRAQVVAEALATSSFLERNDLAGFHRRASDLLQKEAAGTNVVLSDKNAQMIVNTLRPFGERLPRHGNPLGIRRVFETGRPDISNVFTGAILGGPNFSIDVPVRLNGKVQYVLSVALVPQQIFQLIGRQRFPDDWIVAIFDSTGSLLTRSQFQDKFAGEKVTPELLKRLQRAPNDTEGVIETETKEGVPSLIIYSHSPLSKWGVGIAIPREKLEVQLRHTVSLVLLGFILQLSLGAALAWFIGGRIARSVTALTAPAIALEAGELVLQPRVYFREAHAVAEAMTRTARVLLQRITERQHAERELRSANASRLAEALFTEQLLVQLPIGVALRTADGDLIDANPAFLAILGRSREQLQGLTNAQVTPPEFKALDEAQTRILQATGHYGPYEKEYIRGDASRVPVQVRGRFVEVNGTTRLLSVAEDISARRESEFQQSQSQKMDAIGQLTGGLAHDFNNMLGVIIGNLDLLIGSAAGDRPAKEKLEIALSAAMRGADLTRALLSVARAQAITSEPINLNLRLTELLPLIRHTAGGNVEVRMALSDAPTVEVDPGSLASTVLNVVINARDAMPDGGKLTISTHLRPFEVDVEAPGPPPKHYAALCVTDTGTGMSPEVMARARTPFFTTKARGRGTGLGLAMAHGFVKQCGGELLLYSELGRGTTVKLLLPTTASAPVSVCGATVAPDVDARSPARGTERILVVDDEIELLAVSATWLKDLGYTVTPCGTPGSALAALGDAIAAGQPYALMVTDVIMPGMDGFALASAARVVQPALALLYVSGFADASDRGRERPAGDILEKPFRQPALASLVRSTLDLNKREKT